ELAREVRDGAGADARALLGEQRGDLGRRARAVEGAEHARLHGAEAVVLPAARRAGEHARLALGRLLDQADAGQQPRARGAAHGVAPRVAPRAAVAAVAAVATRSPAASPRTTSTRPPGSESPNATERSVE